MPESFIQTAMLYINMEINGVKFQAFVDSGAQSTIISEGFAEKVGLTKDIDSRFQGTAVGVGTTKIVGRIHAATLKIADNVFIQCSLQVLANNDMDFLLGLDMLKKHRCRLDLKDNCLEFTERDVKVPFLPEHLIERKKKLPISAPTGQDSGLSTEEKVKKLQDMGASKEQAQALLQRVGGDLEMAAALFFESMQQN